MIDPDNRKVVLLASGGIDSSSLCFFLKKHSFKLKLITFDYESKHNEAEYNALIRICNFGHIDIPPRISLSFINRLFVSTLLKSGRDTPRGHYEDVSMKQTVVPGRNSIMLSIAAGYAQSLKYSYVAYANHAGDHYIYPDTRPDFVDAMNTAISLSSEGSVSLLAPFTYLTKADIVQIGAESGTPLELTWSCYEGRWPFSCGHCGSCVERHWAFGMAGIPDPTQYKDNPEQYLEGK
jgi:7-cyano-7-deazaguanine synthase